MGCVSSTLTYRTEIGFRDALRPVFFCFWRDFGELEPQEGKTMTLTGGVKVLDMIWMAGFLIVWSTRW